MKRIFICLILFCSLLTLYGCDYDFVSFPKDETVMVYGKNGYEAITDEELEDVKQILQGTYTLESNEDFSFAGLYSEYTSFKCGELIFFPSQDGEPIIKCNGKIKNISLEELFVLNNVFKNHGQLLIR